MVKSEYFEQGNYLILQDILKGRIPIGNKNDKIWKNIDENISKMNDEYIKDIPEKIALNNQKIKNIDGEIKSLKKRKKKTHQRKQ